MAIFGSNYQGDPSHYYLWQLTTNLKLVNSLIDLNSKECAVNPTTGSKNQHGETQPSELLNQERNLLLKTKRQLLRELADWKSLRNYN